MQNSKHCLKNNVPQGKKNQIIISRCNFPLFAPRGLSAEEKQHVQEVRLDVRKAFSGSIQAGEREREREGGSQPARQTDRHGERHPEPRGGEESLQGTACAFQEYCYTSESVLAGTSHSAPSTAASAAWGRGNVRLWGDVTGVSLEAEDSLNAWLLTAAFIIFL